MKSENSILTKLKSRWLKFAEHVEIHDAHKAWQAIAVLHTEPQRKYHNIEHVNDCLDKLDSWPKKPHSRNSIELALWFHDIIYESTRADNESSSAALLRHFLGEHPLVTEAGAFIMATEHKQTSGMPSEEIMCDIDLSILGSPENIYQDYAGAIRQEYDWVEQELYNEKRSDVLRNFLNLDNIFHTSYARSQWQDQARVNLQMEINTLKSH